MLKTTIDHKILVQFFKERSSHEADDENFETWFSFKRFIKTKCSLEIINFDKSLNPDYLKDLTTGGEDSTTILKYEGFEEPLEYKFDVFSPYEFICIIQPLNEKKRLYENNNGLLIAFEDDYLFDKWQKLSLVNKDKIIPVSRIYNGKTFKSWNELENYLLPFTDVVIADNYLLTKEQLVESNLKPILLQLDKATPVTFNLTIITFEGEESLYSKWPKYKLNGKTEFDKLSSFIKDNKIKCELSFVLVTKEVKPHDRGIFMNYLRINSGDSFNYFTSWGDLNTHGTNISFFSMVEPDNFNSAKADLESLSNIVKTMRNKDINNDTVTYTFGNMKNRLLII